MILHYVITTNQIAEVSKMTKKEIRKIVIMVDSGLQPEDIKQLYPALSMNDILRVFRLAVLARIENN